MRRPRTIHRRLWTALAVAMLGAAVVGVPASAASTTVVVDADGRGTIADCDARTRTADSIQDAVDAAAPGTTIRVCPGTYPELIAIGAGKDGLTLIGTARFGARVRIPAGVDAPALVHVDGADQVAIRGLTLLSGSTAGCGTVDAAILVQDARQVSIRGNRVQPTTTDTISRCSFPYGIALGSSGPLSAAAAKTPLVTGLVGWNLVRDPLFGGIIVSGTRTKVTVHRNSVRYWHQGEARTAGPRLKPRGINGLFGTVGIGIERGADAIVTSNVVSSGPSVPVGRRPAALWRQVSPAGSGPPILQEGIGVFAAGTVRVADNGVQRVRVGISIRATGPTRVVGNRVRNVLGGIRAASTGARYLDNTIRGAQTGIDIQATGQILRDNVLIRSARIDCLDETSGAGTLGTGNTWTGNEGTVSYPAGICGDTPPDITVTFNVSLELAGTTAVDIATPASIGGTIPGSPIALIDLGGNQWTASVDLPLGGTHTYHYLSQLGRREWNGCVDVDRPLTVANQGGLRMTLNDLVESFRTGATPAC